MATTVPDEAGPAPARPVGALRNGVLQQGREAGVAPRSAGPGTVQTLGPVDR